MECCPAATLHNHRAR